MAVSSDAARVVHTANGVATFFSYAPMDGVTSSNLKVYLFNPTTGVLTPQTLGTHYSFGGGGVTFFTAPPAGRRVILARIVDLLQPDIYKTNAPFPAVVTENRFDEIVKGLQQINDIVQNRTILLPIGDSGFSNNIIPAVENRKGKVLFFNQTTGDPEAAAFPDSTVPAVAKAGDIMTGFLTLSGAPTAPLHAATKGYVDNFVVYRNRIINGAMLVSQERGNNFVDITSGLVYTVDQWAGALTTSPGGTLRVQRQAIATPGGSPFRLRHTVQATDASIAAGDVYSIHHLIEGFTLADSFFGSASARRLLVRFGVRSSIAGTFSVAFRNGAANRSWLSTFTISGGEVGQDVVREFVIPGDTTGSWPTDNTLGSTLSITLACGTTFQGVAGWQSGNFVATSAQSNFMATSGATFDVFDVGLWVDPTGNSPFPRWEMPELNDELVACYRYYERSSTNQGSRVFFSGNVTNAGGYYAVKGFMIEKRAIPAVSLSNLTLSNFLSFSVDEIDTKGFRGFGVANGTGVGFFLGEWTANARL